MKNKYFLLNHAKLFSFVAILNVAGLSSPAFAANKTNQITLDAVLQQASTYSPRFQIIDKDYQEKLAEAKMQTIFDNPELAIKSSKEKTEMMNSRMTEIELMQPLQISKVLRKKHLYAHLLADTATIEQKFERLKLINEISANYLECWLLQDKQRIYNSFLQDVKTLADIVDADTSLGQVNLAEKYVLQAEMEKIKAELFGVTAALGEKIINLSQQVGANLTENFLEKPTWAPLPKDYTALIQFAKDSPNNRNIALAKLEAAESRVANAKLDAWAPKIIPKIFRVRQSGDDKRVSGVGVNFMIPLWDTNQPERKKAESEYAAIYSEIVFNNKLTLEDNVKLLYNAAKNYQLKADSYYDKVIASSKKSYEYSLKRYQTKQINAMTLWQVRTELLEIEGMALEAVMNAYQMRNLLELEIGGKIEEIRS